MKITPPHSNYKQLLSNKPSNILHSLTWRLLASFASPKKLAEYLYRRTYKRNINWNSPEDLNQWINYISFYGDTSEWPILADKISVQQYVKDRGLGAMLVKQYNAWDCINNVDLSTLPNQFVLKMNNGSGDVMVVPNKSLINTNDIKKHFERLFAYPYGRETAEPHYLKISPKLFAEEFLNPNDQDTESSSLIDYKFWCFYGNPYLCLVCSDRTKESFVTDCYLVGNSEWIRADEKLIHNSFHKRASTPMKKPKTLLEMLNAAKILSAGHPQARVDFYEVGGKCYFGEMTMTAASGRMTSFTPEALVEMGNIISSKYNL